MKIKNKNLSRFFVTIPALLLTVSIIAQEGENLVTNSSFEDAAPRKVRRLGAIEAADGWYSPTKDKADLFISGASIPDIQTPTNVYGEEDPKDGMNYAGIIAYSYREKENRSYLTTKLKEPLIKGMRYKVQFYASLGELSKYSANKLGAHLSRKSPDQSSKVPALILDTHIEHPKQEIFDGTYGWDLVCGEYTATGNEKYITIGNFTNDNEVKVERVRKPKNIRGQQVIAAYYYIDDVSVQLLGSGEKCDCGYADEAVVEESNTVYQRAPQITKNMSVENQLKEYNVYYPTGRYDVRVEGQGAIEQVAKLMKENPGLKIKVTGHSDPSEAGNGATQNISNKRADYIRTILGTKGIDKNRIYTEDVRDSKPSQYIREGDEDNLKAAKNRRVTFSAI